MQDANANFEPKSCVAQQEDKTQNVVSILETAQCKHAFNLINK